jgi:hypothetical protein
MRLISIVAAFVSLLYALYLGLHGLPGQMITKDSDAARISSSSAQPWVFGLVFAGVLAVFCLGVALRIEVMVSCALFMLSVGSAVLFTSYGLHFLPITSFLIFLTYYERRTRVR